ncbi:MAG: DUF2142 domain-containing protein, partial [Chloroflexota bacterium]|nr:DUF2142 domain-containing protein [Chloroflexota bacterium]
MTVETSSLPRVRIAVLGGLGRWAITPLLRWLLLLVGLFALLISAYSSVTHWRSDGANAVSSPLMPGTTIGQTFVSRYPNLSGLEVRVNPKYFSGRDAGATLVMHLREAPGASRDVATSTLYVTGAVEESQYQLFAFAPLAGSRDQTYYVEIESPDATADNAPALLWWVQFDPNLYTDTYAGGVAFYNGAVQQADLAFGLRYDPAPLEAFSILAAHAGVGKPVWLLFLLSAGGGLLLLRLVYLTLRRKPVAQSEKFPLLRWSLPLALGVALAHGAVYAWLVPPWQGPDEHGHFAYAALLYKHDFDASAVQNLQWQEGGNDRQEVLDLKAAIVRSMDEYDWTRRVVGHPTPGAPAFPSTNDNLYLEVIWQNRQPPPYYWLCAAALRIANTVGLAVDPLADPASALMVMRYVSVFFNLCVVALAWCAGALIRGRRSWLSLLLPLTIALSPMRTFIGSVVSNDVVAELSGSLVFISVIALLKWPWGWRGAGLTVLAMLTFLTGIAAKGTALVVGAPILGLGLLVWFGMLATKWLQRRRVLRGVAGSTMKSLLVPASIAIATLVLGLLAAALLFRYGDLVAAWQDQGGPTARTPRVRTEAHDGSYALLLDPGRKATQWVDTPWPHPIYTATLTFWARSAGSKPATGTAELILDQRGNLSQIGAETLGRVTARTEFTPTQRWQEFSLVAQGTRGDRKAWVQFSGGAAPVLIDSIAVHVYPQAGDEDKATEGKMLAGMALPVFNPSAEIGSLSISRLGRRILRDDSLGVVDVLVNPQAYDKLAVWRR